MKNRFSEMIKLYLIMIIGCGFYSMSAQNEQLRTISGTVTDTDEIPVIGATVVVKGTSGGTITDVDGNYQLSLNEETPTLIFSYIGYETQEILIPEGTNTMD